MRKRTRAREFTVQVLYQMDVTGGPAQAVLDNFWQAQDQENAGPEIKNFAAELAQGVEDNLAAIDVKIAGYATNWQLERMAMVDRNILRLGCFELTMRQDIPPKVSINEAVDLAKKYSGPEAGKFVNAILDKIKAEVDNAGPKK
ncbi:MAG: transcription antitermination factor NusB [Omnitrophica WOR_2 bacterium RIFCSPLOWO2_12_FULL_51_8]|nr:MAG: transcription antitermination factor NusB [Omnitrophica WOR_2 bacterium RIFCSPLOWO2_12_FULL_51_8]